MSSDYSPRSGGARRSRRRGGRSGQGGANGSNGGNARNNRGGERREGGASAPKQGFLAKLAGLLGLGKKPARAERPARTEPRSEHPTVRRANEHRANENRAERGERAERAPRAERPARAERQERPAREAAPKPELEAPNPDAVVVPRLYVGNLSYDTAESDLFDLFSKVGSVRNVEMVMDRRTNRSKGFGFVEMSELDVAKKAVMELHRSDFMGRQIVVSGAKSERREAPVAPEVPPIE